MKKVLFATTALIATAGMAAADVRISGYGRFGVDYNGAKATQKSTITSRLRIQFDMSTETDSGIVLGARLRMQTENRDNVVNGNAGAGAPGYYDANGNGVRDAGETIQGAGRNGTTTANGARFFIGYGGLSVYVGNIIGALDNLPGIYLPTTSVSVGVDGMGFAHLVWTDTYDAGTSTGAGPSGIEALYSVAGFTGHISYSQDNFGFGRTGFMAAYSWGDHTVAAAYQSSDFINNNIGAITYTGQFNRFGVRVAYADNDGSSKFMVAVDFEVGAAGNIVAYYSDNSNKNYAAGGGLSIDGSSYGLEYNMDLGGGATFVAGIVSQQNVDTIPDPADLTMNTFARNTSAQVGVRFNF